MKAKQEIKNSKAIENNFRDLTYDYSFHIIYNIY